MRVKYALFLCGQVGVMCLARFFFGWMTRFADSGGAGGEALFSGALVGYTLLLFRIFDGITDPIAGTLSDWWRRKGRPRQQLLLFFFLLPAIGLVLCFLPSLEMDGPLRWTVLASGMFVFFVGYTLYAIPYWSLVDDYSCGNPVARRRLSNLLGLGMMIATGIGFLASGPLIEKFGYATAAGIFAVVGCILMPLPFFAAPEKGTFPEEESPKGEHVPLPKALKMSLTHARFLGLIALFSGSQMSFTIMTAAAPFITIDLLGGTEKDVPFVLGPLLGVAIPFFLFVPALSKKLGWEKGMLLASIGLALVYTGTGGLGKTLIVSPMVTAALVFALAGPMVAVLLGMEGEAIVDCARERAGDGMAGIYWGVFNFIVKIMNGVALLISGYLADWGQTAGNIAVRSMGFAAGACLACGVAVYLLVKLLSRKPAD